MTIFSTMLWLLPWCRCVVMAVIVKKQVASEWLSRWLIGNDVVEQLVTATRCIEPYRSFGIYQNFVYGIISFSTVTTVKIPLGEAFFSAILSHRALVGFFLHFRSWEATCWSGWVREVLVFLAAFMIDSHLLLLRLHIKSYLTDIPFLNNRSSTHRYGKMELSVGSRGSSVAHNGTSFISYSKHYMIEKAFIRRFCSYGRKKGRGSCKHMISEMRNTSSHEKENLGSPLLVA